MRRCRWVREDLRRPGLGISVLSCSVVLCYGSLLGVTRFVSFRTGALVD